MLDKRNDKVNPLNGYLTNPQETLVNLDGNILACLIKYKSLNEKPFKKLDNSIAF